MGHLRAMVSIHWETWRQGADGTDIDFAITQGINKMRLEHHGE